MIAPPSSRNTLAGESFIENETEYILSLPYYYAEVFKAIAPRTFQKLIPINEGFGVASLTFRIQKPAVNEAKTIKWFIDHFKRIVIIAINKNIKSHFNNELDSCIALEYIYNFEKNEKTHYGKLFNTAKYNQNQKSVSGLIDGLFFIMRYSPYIGNIRDAYITYVPPYNKKYYLPRLLAIGLVKKANGASLGYNLKLIDARIKCEKPDFKEVPIDQKFSKWEEIYNTGVSFSEQIKNISLERPYGPMQNTLKVLAMNLCTD
jgi:hypothetical protein